MVKYNRKVGEGVGRDSSTVAKLLCGRASEFSFFVVQTMFTLFFLCFIIAKSQLMSSAAPSKMFFTYKKHRASTAT